MKKTKLIFLILPLIIASWTGNAKASTQLSSIPFENSLVDSLGWASTIYAGTPTYVSGHGGNAVRTSHNVDDGSTDPGDLTYALPGGLPASGEVYISYWVQYDSNYWGLCSSPSIWNVKLLSTPSGSGPHFETIFQNYSDGAIGISWQMDSGMSWDGTGNGVKYGNRAYSFGDWLHVEFYMKASTGVNHENTDGVAWLKLNDTTVITSDTVVTGDFTRSIWAPSIKGTCDCATGQGWWLLDDYEVWDGVPNETSDTTAPNAPSGLSVS